MNNKIPKILIGQINSNLTNTFGADLAAHQFSIQTSDRGEKILSLMENGSPPDILLMDLFLQDPDSFQICRTVKANPDLVMIPILIMTRDNDVAV